MNLKPEKRQNVNGHLVTKWVRDGDDKTVSASLRNAPSVGSVSVSENIDWDRISSRKATKLAAAALETLDDPDRLWQNLDFFTAMMESKENSDIALELNGADTRQYHGTGRVLTDLQRTWQRMHGVEGLRFAECSNVGGDEGFDTFTSAAETFTDAANNASERKRIAHNESITNPSFGDRLKKLSSDGLDAVNNVIDSAVRSIPVMDENTSSKTPFGVNPMLHGAQSYTELLEDAYPTREKK